MALIANENLNDLFIKLKTQSPPIWDDLIFDFYSKKDDKVNATLKIPPPIIHKKVHKTMWLNVKDFMKVIRRDPDHVLNFINTKVEFTVENNIV